MKKIAILFLGCSLYISTIDCVNDGPKSGEYEKAFSNLESFAMRFKYMLIAAVGGAILGHCFDKGSCDVAGGKLAGVLAGCCAARALLWRVDFFPRPAYHLKKVKEVVCEISSFASMKTDDRMKLEFKLEQVKMKVARELWRLRHQLPDNYLSVSQKNQAEHYQKQLLSAQQHTQKILVIIRDDKASDGLEATLKEVLNDNPSA